MVSGILLIPLLLLSSGQPVGDSKICQRVDLIELNHFFDDLGRHAYDQVIFFEWSEEYLRYDVIAWCLVEHDDGRVPVHLPSSGEYVVRWFDRDARAEREVRSQLFRETWTQIDPERANKRLLEEKYRISLFRAPGRVAHR
jgi:hypothetical protein